MAAAATAPALPVTGIYWECAAVGTRRAAAHARLLQGLNALYMERNTRSDATRDSLVSINGQISAKLSVKWGEKLRLNHLNS